MLERIDYFVTDVVTSTFNWHIIKSPDVSREGLKFYP